MEDQQGEIRIYVACLAAYNNGILHGAWINADQDADDIREGIAAMLKASPIAGAEEYAIHDYEGFEGASLSEYSGIDEVAALAEFIAEHGALGGKLMQYFDDLEEAREAIEERYCGVFSSLSDYMEELTSETTAIPENLAYYIDWERMARDAELGGELLTIQTAWDEVHVFSCG